MKVQVEEISAVERKIVVEVDAAEVDSALEQQYRQLGKTARVRGFRPGKVPRGLVRKMFKADAENGASSNLLQGSLMKAFEEADVEPLNMPDVEPEKLEAGQPFVFALFCQVRPTIELQGLDSISAAPAVVEPTDEAIAEELESRRLANAELEPVEERGAENGDVTTIDFVGRLADEEEPFEGGTAEGHELELGTGSLIPGFEEQLIGAKEGDEVKVEVTFPEDYSEPLAGKAAVFDVKVTAVRRKVLPELDDDFAVDLGFDDLSALKADVYDSLSSKLREAEKDRIRGTVIDQLLQANQIDVPQVLVDQSAEQLQRQLAMQFQMSGLGQEHLASLFADQTDSIRARASELARRDLLLDALADAEKIEVTDEEVDERIGEIAEKTGQPRPKVRALLQSGDRIDSLKAEIRTEKTLAWLEEQATMRHTPSDDEDTSGDSE